MKKFLLVLATLAVTASFSDACVAGRRASKARTVTKTKTVARAGVSTPVRSVLVAPVRVVGAFLPCPNCR